MREVHTNQQETNRLIDLALDGNAEGLEQLLLSVQDMIFNLSLRMLGTVPDAEDATQDILVRIMTSLSTFRKESSFHTWVYRIATNYLINYKKSMFAQHPLDFEFYGNDIKYAVPDETENLVDELTRETMAEELKMSCTNVMLQCLDAESRCIFVLGTMFKVDSRIAGEILNMTAENYRQKLSRIRKKVGDFLSTYCGLSGSGGCSCKKRVGYAISQHRINPEKPDFLHLKPVDKETMSEFKNEMEKLDELSLIFEELPDYQSPAAVRERISSLIQSSQLKAIQSY